MIARGHHNASVSFRVSMRRNLRVSIGWAAPVDDPDGMIAFVQTQRPGRRLHIGRLTLSVWVRRLDLDINGNVVPASILRANRKAERQGARDLKAQIAERRARA